MLATKPSSTATALRKYNGIMRGDDTGVCATVSLPDAPTRPRYAPRV